ncbi:methylmalonyl-CoA epimerase [Salinigranum salinum]|uniref:methylmalonyl-CoA epimerase n=1 Tax=Salinigranum salinum TaxID=1364937 RepID=UPI001260DE42|nr:methylmalonyl-CoA epimerase [Salinigranum salinum]
MRLDHIGIATTDAAALADLYVDLFDATVAHIESGDIDFVFVEVDGSYFEFLEPVDVGTDIGQYIQEHGTGFHHVGIEVDDLPAALEHARDLGVDLIDDEPRPGAWGHDIAFLDPDSTGGLLVEFFQH